MKNRLILISVLVLGLVLRLIKADQSLWLDEASQAQMSSLSISQIWSSRSGDFHPPLFYILAHYWIQLGHSEVWLRLLPISFGVANIYVLYLLAKELKINGLLAAFLLAIAPFHIYYSQEFRSYSLLCLLGTLSMYFLYQKKYLQLGIINALLFYTHYSSIFLIITQIFLLNTKKDLRSYILNHISFIVLTAPWIPQFSKQLTAGTSIDTYLPGWKNILSVTPLKTFPLVIFKIVAGRINFLSRYLYGVYILFVFAVTFGAAFVANRDRKLLFTWVFLPVFLMIVTSLAIPQSQPFRVLFILPGLILVFTQACARFPKLFLTLLVYISVTGNITYFTRPRLQREQWRQAIEFLDSQKAPVIVKFSDRFAPFYWYQNDLTIIAPIPTFPAKPEDVSVRLKGHLPGQNRIFILDYLGDLTDPDRFTDQALTNLGFNETKTYNFEGVGFIREYSRI